MAADESVPAHLSLGALKELGRQGASDEPSVAAASDSQSAMEAIVERLAPQPEELRDVPADPIRDLDFQALVGRPMDELALSWLPYLPAATKAEAERVDREVVAAARRLGVGRGLTSFRSRLTSSLTEAP
jgi:hypothetical protein